MKTIKYLFGNCENVSGSVIINEHCSYSESKGYGFLGIDKNSADYAKVVDGYFQDQDTLTELKATSECVYSNKDHYPIRFAQKVEPNTFYKVIVTLGNDLSDSEVMLTSERRHVIMNHIKIKKGESFTKEFSVGVHNVKWKNRDGGRPVPTVYEDDMLNISVIGKNASIRSIEITQIPKPRTLWIFGDSTVCDTYTAIPHNGFNTAAGWGMLVLKYVKEDIAVINLSEGGLSTRETSYFDIGKDDIAADDLVLLQMGHNEKSVENYINNLDYYEEWIRTKGAHLVLCSSIARLQGDQKELPWPKDTLYTDYQPAASSYASQKKLPFINLNTLTYEKNDSLGLIAPWFLHSAYWNITSEGLHAMNDRTHLNDYGADMTCNIVMTRLKELSNNYPVINEYIKDTLPDPVLPTDEFMKDGTTAYVMPPLNDNAEYFPKPQKTNDFEHDVELYNALTDTTVEGKKRLSNVTVKRNINLSYITVFAEITDQSGHVIYTEEKRLEPSLAGSSEIVEFDQVYFTNEQKVNLFVREGASVDHSLTPNKISIVLTV